MLWMPYCDWDSFTHKPGAGLTVTSKGGHSKQQGAFPHKAESDLLGRQSMNESLMQKTYVVFRGFNKQ